MKKLFILELLLCLCFSNLFAQHHIVEDKVLIDDKVYPEGSNRDGYSPVLWEKTNLYYYIGNFSNDLSSTQCQTAVQNAFNTWAQYSKFTFTQTYNLSQADIHLSWEVGNHSNYCPSFYEYPYPIAHSSYGQLDYVTPPCFVHFNDDYTFSTGGTYYDVESIALHEIGHCLGLGDEYVDTLCVMYYQITPGLSGIKRNLTIYDLTTLYNTYNYAFYIIGPELVSTNATYFITNLPSGLTVEWNLSDSYYNQNCLQQNYPSQNECTITRNSAHDMIDATLTATIKYNGTTIQTLTKTGLYAFTGFKGIYTSSFGSGHYTAPNSIFTAPNTLVTVTSPRLVGATLTYTGDATPSYWNHSNNTLSVRMPSTGAAIIVYVHCSNGDDYIIPIVKSNSPYLSVSFSGETLNILLDESVSKDQSWILEIYNAQNGEKIITQEVFGNTVSLNTSGWKRGLYIVRATIGKIVLTEKIQVK